MNEHIELVKKWLADPESVTKQDMEANAANTAAAYAAANAVYAAAAYAAAAADSDSDSDAAYWVKRYEKLKEQE